MRATAGVPFAWAWRLLLLRSRLAAVGAATRGCCCASPLQLRVRHRGVTLGVGCDGKAVHAGLQCNGVLAWRHIRDILQHSEAVGGGFLPLWGPLAVRLGCVTVLVLGGGPASGLWGEAATDASGCCCSGHMRSILRCQSVPPLHGVRARAAAVLWWGWCCV